LHTVLGIPAILSGILSQLALWSLNLIISGGKAIIAINTRVWHVIATPLRIWESIGWVTLVLVVLIAAIYWFFGTERGCSIRATGNNLNMSRAQGINTDVNKVIGLMISNALVALSGALLTQYQGGANINMGKGAIVIGLAAVIIGEALVSKISKNFAVQLIGVVLGSIVYFIIYQIISFVGLDTNLLKMLSALVVAIFLAVPYLKKKYFSKRQTQKAIDALKESELAPVAQAEENVVAEGEENA
jgi:putative ABC transport system permease protein